MSIGDIFNGVTSIAMVVSLILIWLTAKVGNQRKKKELTIQHTENYDVNNRDLLKKISTKYVNGRIDVDAVVKDGDILCDVERYLFQMERIAVAINTNVLDIYIFDRVMGQKTIEHYNALLPFIEHIRKTDYAAKYTEFESLCKRLIKIREKRFPKKENHTKGTLRNFFN